MQIRPCDSLIAIYGIIYVSVQLLSIYVMYIYITKKIFSIQSNLQTTLFRVALQNVGPTNRWQVVNLQH